MSKKFEIVGNDISDGYHTFDELYEHRCLLFIAWMLSDGRPGPVFWQADHFDGWDLIRCDLKEEGQISYHVPIKFRPLYEHRLPIKPPIIAEYDGHTSADVLERLMKWIKKD